MPTTPYTVLREYAPYISPYNIDLAKDVALYKQAKVDASRQAINQQVDYLMGQDIIKEGDREYLQNRMAETIGRINEIYAGADLSSDGIVRHIQGEISSVLDNRVMNAIAGTMEYRRMSSVLQELQESGDDSYSAMNAFVAMQPAYDWINDGKVGSRLGQLTYVPYFDYNKDLATKMKQIVDSHKGTTYEIPIYDDNGKPTGRMQKVTRDQMTPYQARQYAMAGLDQRALQQMQIEAQYLASSQPEAFSLEAARSYVGNTINEANEYLKALEAQRAGAEGDKEKLAFIDNEIKSVKADIKSYSENLANMTPETYSPYSGAYDVIMDRYGQNAAQLYSYDNSSYEMTVDQAYWNKLREDRENAEFAWRKFYQSELLRLKKQGNTPDDTDDTGGEDTPDTSGITRTQLPYTGEVSDVDKETEERFNKAFSDYETQYLRLSNNLPKVKMDYILSGINNDINEHHEASVYYGMNQQEAIMEWIRQNGGLANSDFWTLPDNATQQEKEALQTARQAYVGLIAAGANLAPEKERTRQEADIYRSALAEYAASHDDAADAIVHWAFSRLREDVDVSHVYPSITGPYTQYIPDNGFTKDHIEEVQSVLDVAGVLNVDLSKIYDYNPSTGTYFINFDAEGLNEDEAWFVDRMRALKERKAEIDQNKVLSVNEVIQGRNVREQILQARQSYLKANSPNITNISNDNQAKDYARSPGRQLSSLYESKRQQAGLFVPRNILSWSIYRSGLGDNGQPQYILVPTLASPDADRSGDNSPLGDEAQKYAVTLSQNDLVQNGIPVDESDSTLELGDYSSPRMPVVFASKNNLGYAEYLQSQGLDARYADVDNAKKALFDGIRKLMPTNGTTGAITENAGLNLMNTINFILDKSRYFAVAERGFDARTGFSSGIETTIYLIDPENKGKKPVEAITKRTPATGYADVRNRQIQTAPQVVFMQMLSDMVSDQIQYMMLGNESIESTSDLYRLQEMLMEKIGVRDADQ